MNRAGINLEHFEDPERLESLGVTRCEVEYGFDLGDVEVLRLVDAPCDWDDLSPQAQERVTQYLEDREAERRRDPWC